MVPPASATPKRAWLATGMWHLRREFTCNQNVGHARSAKEHYALLVGYYLSPSSKSELEPTILFQWDSSA